MYELLRTIDSPADLRQLPRANLVPLAKELRDYVLHSVASTGGHLSANLGSVELAIALHYVFDTPDDRLVWDVGHQSYPHKILTGRRDALSGIRQLGGISGFPRRSESDYDAFGTAHSSTALSAALGMAFAARISRRPRHSIAVVGDGALSAGMAFEAMNNAGIAEDIPLLMVLNDNDMSISPPVGALRACFGRLVANRFHKQGGSHTSATLFEEFGFSYTGPIDGHDLEALVPALEELKKAKGPQLLHVVTQKGHGYAPAEKEPIKYHGPGKFDPAVGLAPSSGGGKPSYTEIFSQWICDEAERDPRIVAITPAMREGSGLIEFERRFPERYFDVAIAEQHAVTFAGGLASDGLRPVVAIYSTFLQRGYDQLIHDIALQNLPVAFAIDRAGIVGADGATHMGAFDIAYLRCIPNMVVMAPGDENECRQMLHTAVQWNGPCAVRYPRGAGPGAAIEAQMAPIPIGVGEIRRRSTQAKGRRVAILAFGSMLVPSLAAAAKLDATVANMRFVKPLDHALIRKLARTHDVLVTVEEGCLMGGAGAACLEYLSEAGLSCPVLRLGLPDTFIEHGDPAKLVALAGLDAAGIEASIRGFLEQRFPFRSTLRSVPVWHGKAASAEALPR